jgi:hypothetical protein
MKTPETLPRMYEDLANHYARHGESRQRDNCLVLAADAALSAGQSEEAERLRRRLLLTNPHHLVRAYASMAEAMQVDDVRDFVADLRKQLPPDTVSKLLNQAAPEKTYALAEPVAHTGKPASNPRPAKAAVPGAILEPEEAPTPASYWGSLAMLGLGLVFAGALLFATLIWPFLE